MSHYELYEPQSYRKALPSEKKEICNGCGAGGWKYDIVPDTIWGLDITEACNIHDWMYEHGKTEQDKYNADRIFLENMLFLIDSKTKWTFVKWLRRRRAYKYYDAVSLFGNDAFWKNKKK